MQKQGASMKTLDSFLKRHKLEFACKRVDARPDGLMDSDHMTRHFHVRISRETRSFSLYFSQGSAHREDPTLADVLDCLASDASGFENAQFQSTSPKCVESAFQCWAGEYGYSTDSRKAEKIYRVTKRQSEQLTRVLGESAYRELLWETERL